MNAADDFDVIGRRLQELKDKRPPGPDSTFETKYVPGQACPHCGRTSEAHEVSPCTGKCGDKPGGRAGLQPEYFGC